MDPGPVAEYCNKFKEAFKKFGFDTYPASIPVPGIVTENYFSYPIPLEHKSWVEERFDADFETMLIWGVGKRLEDNAIEKEPYPTDGAEDLYRKLDNISHEALEEISRKAEPSGIVREVGGEDYLAFSVLKNDFLNENHIPKVLDLIKEKTNEGLPEGESEDLRYIG